MDGWIEQFRFVNADESIRTMDAIAAQTVRDDIGPRQVYIRAMLCSETFVDMTNQLET